jgi:transcriptional regulator with XRE-family HTH domain
MSKLSLGKEIRVLRQKKQIGSRELSRLIGKAETYVSQLEREQIKAPDYETVCILLTHLGLSKEEIESLLEWHGLPSPEKMKRESIEQEMIRREMEKYPRIKEHWERHWEWKERLIWELKNTTGEIKEILDKSVDIDLSKSEAAIYNLYLLAKSMTTDRENLNFFYQMFQFNLTNLSSDEKQKIITVINQVFEESKGGKF